MIESYTYFELEEYHESKIRLETYISKFSNAAKAHNLIGIVFDELNDNIKALYHYHRAYEIESNNIEFLIAYVVSLFNHGNIKLAESVLTDFIKANKPNRNLILGLMCINSIPYKFTKVCWSKAHNSSLKVVSLKPNTVLDTEK